MTVIGRPISGDKSIATPDPSTTNDADEVVDPMAGHGELFRPRRQGKPKANGLRFTRCRTNCYENGVSRALVLDFNDFVDCRRARQIRRQGRQAL